MKYCHPNYGTTIAIRNAQQQLIGRQLYKVEPFNILSQAEEVSTRPSHFLRSSLLFTVTEGWSVLFSQLRNDQLEISSEGKERGQHRITGSEYNPINCIYVCKFKYYRSINFYKMCFSLKRLSLCVFLYIEFYKMKTNL